MKAYGKSWGYNVYDCRYCLYRKGKLKGCVYPDGCCCPVPQKPARRNGIEQVYEADADSAAPVSECEGCPYGRAGLTLPTTFWRGTEAQSVSTTAATQSAA